MFYSEIPSHFSLSDAVIRCRPTLKHGSRVFSSLIDNAQSVSYAKRGSTAILVRQTWACYSDLALSTYWRCPGRTRGGPQIPQRCIFTVGPSPGNSYLLFAAVHWVWDMCERLHHCFKTRCRLSLAVSRFNSLNVPTSKYSDKR